MIRLAQTVYDSEGFRLAADFEIARHSFSAVLGPSGAGKSTLLSLIAGFLPLTLGHVIIDGVETDGVPPAARPVSMIFQDHNAFAHLDSWTNVALGISPSLDLAENDRAAVDEALARVGLSALARKRPGEMSGGEVQRIALARALVRQKPILRLDEPFAALDPGLRQQMLALVNELHQERRLTTLMVTHEPKDARAVADQVIFIDGGEARPPAPTGRFFSGKQDKAVSRYLGT